MNNMTVNQAGTVINQIVSQMTGQQNLAPITNAGDFASVAQSALLSGRDPVMNILNQMWSRTIFAVRPRRNGLDGLYMDMPRWGNAVRKLSPVAGVALDDEAFKWPVTYDATQTGNPLGNGESVDPWVIHKQDFQQVNFYGTAAYEQAFTTFVHQFDTAFKGPEEFAQFNAMNLTERANDRERFRESVARALQVNYIGSIIAENQSGRVVDLTALYNEETGAGLTREQLLAPDNFAGFIRWMYAKINTYAMMMEQDTNMFQTVIDGKVLLRHTYAEDLRVALSADFYNRIRAMALSTTFNDNYLDVAQFEAIPFWQNPKSPYAINVTPVYTGTNGQVVTGAATSNDWVIGVMHDRDALGYADVYNSSYVTPINPRGEYWTTWNHTNFKTIMDLTEKGIVFVLGPGLAY